MASQQRGVEMSKRCELRKEYYKQHGNYKGDGKYSNSYVEWLETKILTTKNPNNMKQDLNYFLALVLTAVGVGGSFWYGIILVWTFIFHWQLLASFVIMCIGIFFGFTLIVNDSYNDYEERGNND